MLTDPDPLLSKARNTLPALPGPCPATCRVSITDRAPSRARGNLPACAGSLMTLCHRMVKRSGADGGAVVLRFGHKLQYVAGSDFAWDTVPPLATTESVYGRVLTERRSVVESNVQRLPASADWRDAKQIGIAAFMGYPVENGDAVVGAVGLHKRTPGEWSNDQAAALDTFAEVVALFFMWLVQCRSFEMPMLCKLSSSPQPEWPIVRSPLTRKVFEQATQIARYSFPVMIVGERGTGKEVLAEHVHAQSQRQGPFVAVNCAAIPREMIEDEFFGHRKGAFSGAVSDRPGHVEAADGGTLFLDEIGELPHDMQSKLLRLVERNEIQRLGDDTARRVNVRIVAATNRLLSSANGENILREDLYDRLAGQLLVIPPLRKRHEDLEGLIDILFDRTTVELSHPVAELTTAARDVLLKYQWPGNIRQLQTVLRQACLSTQVGEAVDVESLPAEVVNAVERGVDNGEAHGNAPAPRRAGTPEAALRLAFERFQGNVTRIAKDLGLKRQTIQRRLRSLGLR